MGIIAGDDWRWVGDHQGVASERIDRLGASSNEERGMRYGMNPHQAARVVGDARHVRVLNGEPSLINWLDLLNAWMLVRDVRCAVGQPAAASFKHVSPAGVAVAGPIDPCAAELWRVDRGASGSLLSAYVRARDVDPKSSFGDAIALSEPCDVATAQFIGQVIADAVIAPGFEPEALAILNRKKTGRFLVVEVDPSYDPPQHEARELFGVRLEQERDDATLGADLDETPFRNDALLGLATLRYTQSNSVCVGKDGMVLGIGAGQQNRVDCTRLAGTKAQTWWLRRHQIIQALHAPDLPRQDLLNWQIRFAEQTLTRNQTQQLARLFGAEVLADYRDPGWRLEWAARWSGLVMCSDGFIPFRDNVDLAAQLGVTTLVEPGGSVRTSEVAAAAAEHGIVHATTGLRLFHH
ncbi:5-aminoimidazole-4-carboxamide ribonucleotide transformylase [Nocardioides sp. CBS4Y-1]|uniref:5-aminoimidazole-4-carboxamide ribonucleotide transformylase n=2 Tax=Nocardioides acrostichi TaxID=2784339 RepID=A0A930UZD1_9ACTN|nr:5-aminoimidazole-4-carboxamide ribonucleotide transformylase [Nocardioides acrostichi]